MSGKLIVIHPDYFTRIELVEGKTWALEKMQELVGGYIERVKVRYEDRARDAYINEEGKLTRKKFNQVGTELYLEYWKTKGVPVFDFIVGTMVIWIPDPRKKRV